MSINNGFPMSGNAARASACATPSYFFLVGAAFFAFGFE